MIVLQRFNFSVEVQEAEWTEKNKVMQGSCSGAGGINSSPRKNVRGEGGASRRSCDNSVSEDQSATLPLLHLVRQLLRNASTQTLMRLQVSFHVKRGGICKGLFIEPDNMVDLLPQNKSVIENIALAGIKDSPCLT